MLVESSTLVPRLVAEHGDPEAGAQLVAAKLAALPSPVHAAFENWWTIGEVPELVVEGYTVRRLAAEHGMNPIAAFLTLGWLTREPQAARASLAKGHDHVG